MQPRTGSIYIPTLYLNQIMRPLPPDNYKIVATEGEKGYFGLIYSDIGLEYWPWTDYKIVPEGLLRDATIIDSENAPADSRQLQNCGNRKGKGLLWADLLWHWPWQMQPTPFISSLVKYLRQMIWSGKYKIRYCNPKIAVNFSNRNEERLLLADLL